MSKKHWSRSILFLSFITLVVIVMFFGLVFLLYDLTVYLYDEFLILIDELGRVSK